MEIRRKADEHQIEIEAEEERRNVRFHAKSRSFVVCEI